MAETETAALARPGERWGEFIFFDAPGFRVPEDLLTPARRAIPAEEVDEFPYGSPGYREFRTIEELHGFVEKKMSTREPRVLPSGIVLLGTYAVVDGDGEILACALNYQLAGSNASFKDPDLWINCTVVHSSPLAYATFDQDFGLGRRALPARKVEVRGYRAVLLEFSGSTDLPRELRLRSAVSWFEDSEFWTVQGRDLNTRELVSIANSLAPLK